MSTLTPPALDAAMPLVGQRFRLTGCTLLPTLACACEKADDLTLVAQYVGGGRWAGVSSQCPGCGTPYVVQTVTMDAQGQLQIGIDVGRAPLAS